MSFTLNFLLHLIAHLPLAFITHLITHLPLAFITKVFFKVRPKWQNIHKVFDKILDMAMY